MVVLRRQTQDIYCPCNKQTVVSKRITSLHSRQILSCINICENPRLKIQDNHSILSAHASLVGQRMCSLRREWLSGAKSSDTRKPLNPRHEKCKQVILKLWVPPFYTGGDLVS